MINRPLRCFLASFTAFVLVAGTVPPALAAGPSVFVSPTSMSFGNVQIQTTSPDQFVSIQNTGDANLAVGSISLTGTTPDQFSVSADGCSSQVLTPNGWCSVNVSFAPSSTGSKSARVSIPSNAPTSPNTISLSGIGVNPSIFVSPTSLSFGNAQVGTVTPDHFVSIQNSGSGNGPLNLGSLTIEGASPDQYVLSADGCSNQVLSPNGWCSVNLAFAPTSTGSKSARLSIPSNAPTSPNTISLSGIGVNPSIFVSPTSLSFGNIQVGANAPEQFLMIQNNGTGQGPLELGTLTLSGAAAAQFSLAADGCSNQILGPNGWCSVNVGFAPASPGAKSATLAIPSNAPTSPSTVSISGTGVVRLQLSPSSLSFGSQKVGTSSAVSFVSATNTGSDFLTLGNVTSGGANAADFGKGTDGCSGTFLSPGQSCSVAVSFTPGAAGTRSAVLSFGLGGGSVDAVLSGTGTVPVISVTPPVLSFGDRNVGVGAAPMGATVRNTGSAPLALASVSATGDFASQSNCGASVAPGDSCTVDVNFVPTELGARTGALSIGSDGGSATVSLTGRGVDTLPPSSAWTTAPNSVRVSQLQSVAGTTSDNVGVSSVKVTFTDVLGSQTTVDATLDCLGRTCDWTATVPIMLPGPVTAVARGTDLNANRESLGAQISLIVV